MTFQPFGSSTSFYLIPMKTFIFFIALLLSI